MFYSLDTEAVGETSSCQQEKDQQSSINMKLNDFSLWIITSNKIDQTRIKLTSEQIFLLVIENKLSGASAPTQSTCILTFAWISCLLLIRNFTTQNKFLDDG